MRSWLALCEGSQLDEHQSKLHDFGGLPDRSGSRLSALRYALGVQTRLCRSLVSLVGSPRPAQVIASGLTLCALSSAARQKKPPRFRLWSRYVEGCSGLKPGPRHAEIDQLCDCGRPQTAHTAHTAQLKDSVESVEDPQVHASGLSLCRGAKPAQQRKLSDSMSACGSTYCTGVDIHSHEHGLLTRLFSDVH